MLAHALNETLEFSVSKGYCPSCRLRKKACFCAFWADISSSLGLYIVAHSEELKKDSNTALLLMKALQNSQLQLWQRKQPIFKTRQNEALVDEPFEVPISERALKQPTVPVNESPETLPVMLLPASLATCYQGEEGRSHPMLKNNDIAGRSFLLLDGSWQQVRKMYRQSPQLKQLDCYELHKDESFPLGEFPLRRNQHDAGVCSAQAIALLLWRLGENEQAESLLSNFQQFCHHVLVSRDQRSGI